LTSPKGIAIMPEGSAFKKLGGEVPA